jgi:hypothetical protein
LVAVSVVALTWLVTCSSSAADGASCSKGSECQSGVCDIDGTCRGHDCNCEGADCHTRSNCDEGWLCTQAVDPIDGPVPRCRRQCGGTFGACANDMHCDNGVCRTGGTVFVIEWTNIPRTKLCGSKVPCEYELRVSEGTTVDKFTWNFGDAPAVVTTEPMTTNTWPTAGTFGVSVEAHATTGAVAKLQATEVVCDGAVGSPCDPNGAPCCEGSCSAQLTCK